MKRIILCACGLFLIASIAWADKKIIVNCTTGKTTIVELTAADITQREKDIVVAAVTKAAEDAKIAREKKIQDEMRAIAIKSLEDKGEL